MELSAAAKAARAAYNAKCAERYRNTPKGKEAIRAAQARYRHSPKGKAAIQAAQARFWERRAAEMEGAPTPDEQEKELFYGKRKAQ